MMEPLHLQNSLRAGASLDALQAPPYSLVIKRHQHYPNLVLFKYDQLNSNMDSSFVCQCRGLILDEADNWNCISRPFDKFWNAHEGRAAEIEWKSARVQEKLDGSLMQLYWYRGHWRVGTSGTPDASGQVNGQPFTFEELFWMVWRSNGMALPADGGRGLTFLFELLTPYNRVVVQHGFSRIILIGVRDALTGREFHVRDSQNDPRRIWNPTWLQVREFQLDSLDKALATFDTMKPLEQEGYVIVDQYFNRIKVKHPGYVALHHMRDSFSPRAFVEVVRKGEVDEVIAAFPEFKRALLDLDRRLDDLVVEISDIYDSLMRQNLSQKDFALRAVQHPWSGILFGIRKGQWPNPRIALQEVQVDKVAGWLNVGTALAIDSQ